jgi:hypothetical protein
MSSASVDFEKSIENDAELESALTLSGKQLGTFFMEAGSNYGVEPSVIQTHLTKYFLTRQGGDGPIEIPRYVQALARATILRARGSGRPRYKTKKTQVDETTGGVSA